jgi:hypothetical protein
LLITSTTIECRREFENDFLRLYYDSLVSNGISEYAFEQVSKDYVKSFCWRLFVFIFVIAVTDFTGAYGRSVVETSLPRLAAFAEDHESILLS